MKTLSAWIVGIFALGLGFGSFISGSASSDLAATDLKSALAVAPDVDCGEGREALLEPVSIDGTTSFKVRCVAAEPESSARPAAHTPAPRVVAAPPAPVVTSSSPVETVEDETSSRSWKQSAVVVGGSAGAGAGIGAIAKGKKGAAVGAAIGAASAAAYELIRRDKKN